MKSCLNCGEKLPENAKYCLICGAKVDDNPTSRVQQSKNSFRNEEKETLSRRSKSTKISTSQNAIWQYFKKFGMWVKSNPLTITIFLSLSLLIFFLLSKMIGIIVLGIAIAVSFLYAQLQEVGNQTSDLLIKRFVRDTIKYIKRKRQAKREEKRQEPQRVLSEEKQPAEVLEKNESDLKKTSEFPKKRRSFGMQIGIFVSIILIGSTYFGPFAAVSSLNFGNQTILLNLLKGLNHEEMLLGLLIGPVLMIIGGLTNSRVISNEGRWLNLIAYGYVFYLIYQREAMMVGYQNVLNNVGLGISSYLAVFISLGLIVFRTRKH